MRSAYLVMVEPDENHNKYYQMTQKTTDTFEVRYGRVGAKGITRKYPISRWASIYESKDDITWQITDIIGLTETNGQKSQINGQLGWKKNIRT